MNKKSIAIGLSIALGSTMLITTAFANTTGETGYDTYKSAIKNTLIAKNFTENAVITVKDNGNVIASVNNSSKLSLDNNAVSGSTSINAGGQTYTIETYNQDGKAIFKSSDNPVYNVMTKDQNSKEFKNKKSENEGLNSTKLNDGELLVDALVGNLQNYVTLDNKSDGSKEISASLSDNQLPAVVNAAASIVVKNAANEGNRMGMEKGDAAFTKNIINSIPKLVDNIRVENVSLKAQINPDNYIVNQVINIIISGKDANGTVHTITADIDMNMLQFNNTTPDQIDLTGKQVNNVTKEFNRTRHNIEGEQNK